MVYTLKFLVLKYLANSDLLSDILPAELKRDIDVRRLHPKKIPAKAVKMKDWELFSSLTSFRTRGLKQMAYDGEMERLKVELANVKKISKSAENNIRISIFHSCAKRGINLLHIVNLSDFVVSPEKIARGGNEELLKKCLKVFSVGQTMLAIKIASSEGDFQMVDIIHKKIKKSRRETEYQQILRGCLIGGNASRAEEIAYGYDCNGIEQWFNFEEDFVELESEDSVKYVLESENFVKLDKPPRGQLELDTLDFVQIFSEKVFRNLKMYFENFPEDPAKKLFDICVKIANHTLTTRDLLEFQKDGVPSYYLFMRVAIQWGNKKWVKRLLQKCNLSDLSRKDFLICLKNGHYNIAKMLLLKGKKINKTVLRDIIDYGDTKTFLKLSKMIPWQIYTSYIQTTPGICYMLPNEYALYKGHLDIFKLISPFLKTEFSASDSETEWNYFFGLCGDDSLESPFRSYWSKDESESNGD